ncbi:outer membrane protein with beta-barrel domain [Tenacibaculum adriaticum]|uniref:Outer membrane protein with beta-barrel domain n=1 Tax=Tenacibaculum adriaticum TaxID=413713 RepID=A0A5S5DWQ8_9FLAO|nr:DUF6089 family protein [Tenacibaculum adriaticum]TYQ00282.1 outer membrane protein with beta-barrel domain [Tenacibaculum adriaticum]
MKKYFISLLLTCTTSISFSQIHEIGFFLGGSNYIGDVGNTNYINPNEVGGGLIYKYNLNPRIALRGTFTYIPISGNDTKASSPYRKQRGYSFTNTIHEFAAGIEFNFFEYNIREHKTSFTPYILAEIAVFNYKTIDYITTNNRSIFENTFSYSIPMGLGVKGRLADNLAYAIESGIRLTFVDNLDYTTDKIARLNFAGTGNDHYIFTGISLVYTFGRPPCYAPRE